MEDPICITKQIPPADSLSQRARQLWKVAKDTKDFKIAVDIYTADNECPRVSKCLIHFTYLLLDLHLF